MIVRMFEIVAVKSERGDTSNCSFRRCGMDDLWIGWDPLRLKLKDPLDPHNYEDEPSVGLA